MTRYEVYASTGYVGTWLARDESDAIRCAVHRFYLDDLSKLSAYPAPHTFNANTKGLTQ